MSLQQPLFKCFMDRPTNGRERWAFQFVDSETNRSTETRARKIISSQEVWPPCMKFRKAHTCRYHSTNHHPTWTELLFLLINFSSPSRPLPPHHIFLLHIPIQCSSCSSSMLLIPPPRPRLFHILLLLLFPLPLANSSSAPSYIPPPPRLLTASFTGPNVYTEAHVGRHYRSALKHLDLKSRRCLPAHRDSSASSALRKPTCASPLAVT